MAPFTTSVKSRRQCWDNWEKRTHVAHVVPNCSQRDQLLMARHLLFSCFLIWSIICSFEVLIEWADEKIWSQQIIDCSVVKSNTPNDLMYQTEERGSIRFVHPSDLSNVLWKLLVWSSTTHIDGWYSRGINNDLVVQCSSLFRGSVGATKT